MSEINAGVCGAHQSELKLYMQLKRLITNLPDKHCKQFAKRCQVWQDHGKFIMLPPEPCMLPPIVAIRITGIDIVGPFEGHIPRI